MVMPYSLAVRIVPGSLNNKDVRSSPMNSIIVYLLIHLVIEIYVLVYVVSINVVVASWLLPGYKDRAESAALKLYKLMPISILLLCISILLGARLYCW